MKSPSVLPIVIQKLLLILGHSFCIVGLVFMLINSGWSIVIFDQTVNQSFSGELLWNRLAWGPYPWQIKIQDLQLIDAKRQPVLYAESVCVEEYSFLALADQEIVVSDVTIHNAVLHLTQRLHTYDSQDVIFNIAELFKPPGIKVDDGELPALAKIHVSDIEISQFDLYLKMPLIEQDVYQVEMNKGLFAMDLHTDKMNIQAKSIHTHQLDTRILLREQSSNKVSQLSSGIEKVLVYPLSRVKINDFWWFADQFAARDLSAYAFKTDTLSLKSWIMDLVPNAAPHFRSNIQIKSKAIQNYISPWIQDKIRGEVNVQAKLHGPVDLLAADDLNTEGQLFIPILGWLRFQIDGSKSRQEILTVQYGRFWSKFGDFEVSGAYDLIKQLGTMKSYINEFLWPKLYGLSKQWKNWEKPLKGEIDFKLRPNAAHSWEMSIESHLFMQGLYLLELKSLASIIGSRIQAHFLDLTIKSKKQQNIVSYGIYDWTKKRLKAHVQADLALAPNILPPLKLPVQGQLKLAFDINNHGQKKSIYLQGDTSLKNTKVIYKKLKWNIPKAQLNFKLDKNILTIKDLYLKKDQGFIRGDLRVPLSKLSQTKGWLILDHFYLDLQPFDIPFHTKLNGLTCSADRQGCQNFIKKYPLHKSQKKNRCLLNLYQDVNRAQGIEMCMSLLQPHYQKIRFKEFALNANWMNENIFLKRARLWKSRNLLLDAQGQYHLKHKSIQLHSKIVNLPLQLIHLFVPQASVELNTLFGTVQGALLVEGNRKNFNGSSKLSFQNISFKTSSNESLAPLIRTAQLNNTFNQDSASFKGNLGNQIIFDIYFPFDKKGKGFLGVDLNQLSLHYFHSPSQGQIGYQNEDKQLLKTHDQHGIDPMSFSDPNRALNLIGFNRDFACLARSLKLPNSHLWSTYIQGSLSMEWDRSLPQFLPWIDIYFETLHTEYWGRNLKGTAIDLNQKEISFLQCQQKKEYPSLSLNLKDKLYMSIQSLYSIADTIWINPKFKKTHTQNNTDASSVSLDRNTIRQTLMKQNLSPHVSIQCQNPKDKVQQKLSSSLAVSFDPMIIQDQEQSLSIQGFLHAKQAYLCLQNKTDLKFFNYYLNQYYQKSQGQIHSNLSIQGHIQNPRLSGNMVLNNLNFISPRSQVMGDLSLQNSSKSLVLDIVPETTGGFSIVLPKQHTIHLRRNENDIFISGLKINLSQFTLKSLSVNFFANQIEFKLADIGRVTTQLTQMHFMMSPIRTTTRDKLSLAQDELDFELLLKGNVDLLRGRYTANIIGSEDIINQGFRNNLTGRSSVESLSVFESAPILKRFKLDLNIKGEDDLFVRNQVGGVLNLNLEVQTDLQIKGYLYSLIQDRKQDQLKLLGEINTLEGSTITYANNTFDVTGGQIRFGDLFSKGQSASFLNAYLEATHTFRIPIQNKNRQTQVSQSTSNEWIDEEVTLRASMEMSTKESRPQIKFDLQSASGASKLEVASLLVTGRYSSDLSASQSTQPATELLLSPLMDLIERPLEDSLGLNLNLTPDNTGSLFVNINQAFSRRWRLYANTAIGDNESDVPQVFGLEYRLNNILLGELTRENTNQLSNTNFRLHLRWSWD